MNLMRIFAWLVVAPGLLITFLLITYLMWPMALVIALGLLWSLIRRRSRPEELRAA